MNDDRANRTGKTGKAKERARNSVKEAIGKVSGDKRTEAEGRAQKEAAAEHDGSDQHQDTCKPKRSQP